MALWGQVKQRLSSKSRTQWIYSSELKTLNESTEACIRKWHISEHPKYESSRLLFMWKILITWICVEVPLTFMEDISNLQSSGSSKIHFRQKSNHFLSGTIHISSNTYIFYYAVKSYILKINVQSMWKANRSLEIPISKSHAHTPD